MKVPPASGRVLSVDNPDDLVTVSIGGHLVRLDVDGGSYPVWLTGDEALDLADALQGAVEALIHSVSG